MYSQPKISFVVVSRNDNHGGDMLKRMRIFTKGLLHQCKKFKLNAELIYVEWNPDEKKPLLKDILPLPEQEDVLTIRFIQVPNELHQKLNHAEKIPLFQMIGKNVGIRRANSEFIVCTNVDLLFSDELINQLLKPLDDRNYYRANRCDIPKELSEELTVDEQLEYADKNIIQRLGKARDFPEIVDTTSWIFNVPYLRILYKHYYNFKRKKKISKIWGFLSKIDTDACGDFTLMSKKNWLAIEGYLEVEAYSIHIDSIAIIYARILGLNQIIYSHKSCTYHISHDNGWENLDPLEKLELDLKRPMIDWSTVESMAKKMLRERKILSYNKPNWGLNDKQLKEYIFEPGKEMQEIN